MKKLSLLACLAISSLGVAQSPLNALAGGTNQGNVGGGLYFDLQVNTTVTITRIDFLCGLNTVAGVGTINVWLGPTTYLNNVQTPALWAVVGSATMNVTPSTVVNGVLTTPFALGPGNYAIALQSSGFNFGYTNGLTCTSTSIPGSCSNSLFSNAELTLRAGAAQNAFLSGTPFTPRIFNGAIHYTNGGTPIAVAAWQKEGQGCYAKFRSFYQNFPNPAGMNLGTGNPVTAFKMVRSSVPGIGYDVVVTNTPLVAPLSQPIVLTGGSSTFLASSAFPNNQLPFTIPHWLNGGLAFATDLEVCTEGYIVPRPATTPANAVVSIASFLAGVPRWAPHWKDVDPLAAGASIKVELDAATNELLVTYTAVIDTLGLSPSTFQVAYSSNGDVEYRYGVMSVLGGGGNPALVGWTEGAGVLDPGNIEIATAMPFQTFTTDNLPLTLELAARPLLGTTINMTTTAIPAGTTNGIVALGFTQINPGLNLALIGMPGCFLLCSFDASAPISIVGQTNVFSLAIPNIPALNGGLLFGQTVTISAGFNSLGVLMSNAVRMKLGSL